MGIPPPLCVPVFVHDVKLQRRQRSRLSLAGDPGKGGPHINKL